MPPSKEELEEIEELKALINGTPSRDSAVPFGAVSRFMVGEENRKRAEDARKEKEERDALKDGLRQQRLEHAQKLKQDALARREREKQEKENARQRKQEQGKMMREHGSKLKEQRAKKAQEEWELGQKRVQEENARWKAMNAAEAAQDKLEREEGTRDRKAVEAAFKAERAAILEANRKEVAEVRAMKDGPVQEALAWAAAKRERAAEARRRDKIEQQAAKERKREEHSSMAQSKKAAVLEIKERAKMTQAELLNGKKAHAAKERDNDYLVQQAKIRDLAVKKRQHQAVFEKKYAPADMAQSWTGASTLRRGRKVTSPMS